jgi:hypothetical protein
MEKSRAKQYVRISESEFQFLLGSNSATPGTLANLQQTREKQGYVVEIDDPLASSLRDEIADYLTRSGFDESYELNPEGKAANDVLSKLCAWNKN